MSRFAVMTLTDAATQRVADIVENAVETAEGIRVGVKNGGCAGMEYTIDLVTEPDPKTTASMPVSIRYT